MFSNAAAGVAIDRTRLVACVGVTRLSSSRDRLPMLSTPIVEVLEVRKNGTISFMFNTLDEPDARRSAVSSMRKYNGYETGWHIRTAA